jgi:hypothetical protein
MQERAQWAPIDDQPRHKGTKLRRREQVDLEHGHGVWPDGTIPELVDAQFRELVADALPQLLRERLLRWVLLEIVDVDVTVFFALLRRGLLRI